MKLSDTEWTVMNAVWAGSPASARDVLERTADETHWAYTTVKTTLARLVDKGVLAEHKRANTSLYDPLLTRDQARHSAVRLLLDKAFDGTFGALLQHLVADEKLSKKDRRKLSEMLADNEGGRRKKS
jgi:BlaI family penicillinase repressor